MSAIFDGGVYSSKAQINVLSNTCQVIFRFRYYQEICGLNKHNTQCRVKTKLHRLRASPMLESLSCSPTHGDLCLGLHAPWEMFQERNPDSQPPAILMEKQRESRGHPADLKIFELSYWGYNLINLKTSFLGLVAWEVFLINPGFCLKPYNLLVESACCQAAGREQEHWLIQQTDQCVFPQLCGRTNFKFTFSSEKREPPICVLRCPQRL